MRLLLTLLLLACGSGALRAQRHVEFAAAAPEIRYVGRTLVTDEGVSFDWSGTSFECRFTGRSFAVRATDTKRNYYNLTIDGRDAGVVALCGRDTLIVLASGRQGRPAASAASGAGTAHRVHRQLAHVRLRHRRALGRRTLQTRDRKLRQELLVHRRPLFRRRRPDLVVIHLGTNDFSTQPYPSRDEFRAAYLRILGNLRAAYGEQTPILCVAPRMGNAYAYIREICDEAPYPNLGFAAIFTGYCNGGSDLGSSAHPNYAGQRKMAMLLIPYVSSLTGWEAPVAPIR